MTHVRDSFLKFLYDNLSTETVDTYDGPEPIVVHSVRASANQAYNVIQSLNAINVEFLGINLAREGSQRVSIDVMYDDEIVAHNVVYKVWNLLKAAHLIPIYDYTNVSSPVLIPQKNVYWEPGRVYFRKLPRSEYAHFSCILDLKYNI